MLDALEQRRREVGELLRLAPDVIALEHGDDLVVGIATIDDFEPPDRARRARSALLRWRETL
jgi:hypothetical protein